MQSLITLAVLALGFALFFAGKFIYSGTRKRKAAYKFRDSLEKMGLGGYAMPYQIIYPSAGVKVQSNFAIKGVLSVHRWTLDYTTLDKVVIKAHGFWSAIWIIEIDLQKAKLLEAGKYEIHQYLVSNGIIETNGNLY